MKRCGVARVLMPIILMLSFIFIVFQWQSKPSLEEVAEKRFPKIYHNKDGRDVEITDKKLKKFYQLRAMREAVLSDVIKKDPSFMGKVIAELLSKKPKVIHLVQDEDNYTNSSYVLVLNGQQCPLKQGVKKIKVTELQDYCVSPYVDPGGWDNDQLLKIEAVEFTGHHHDWQVQKDWSVAVRRLAKDRAIKQYLASLK